MIKTEEKKWFLYQFLPNEVNKVFIYMPANSDVGAEIALTKLSGYLKGRDDTIGKVTRIDPSENIEVWGDSPNGFGLPGLPKYPVIFYQGNSIYHSQYDLVEVLDSHLYNMILSEEDKIKIRALKDGEILL